MDYIVTLTAGEATLIANLLARLGLLIDFTLELPEGDGILFRVEPREIAAAHRTLLDALENRWLACPGEDEKQGACQPGRVQ